MMAQSTKNIRRLFEEQIRDLTQRTLIRREDSFDLQFSGRWLQ